MLYHFATSFEGMGHTCEAQTWSEAEEGFRPSICPAERSNNLQFHQFSGMLK
jgi:hypothetical protein